MIYVGGTICSVNSNSEWVWGSVEITYVCIYVHTRTHTHMHTHTLTYIYNIYNIYIHIYTHTHIYTNARGDFVLLFYHRGFCPTLQKYWRGLCPPCKNIEGDYVRLYKCMKGILSSYVNLGKGDSVRRGFCPTLRLNITKIDNKKT